MLTKFWEGVGGKLAERWSTVAGPALVFWLGGLLAWIRHAGGTDEIDRATKWLDRQTGLTQATVLLGALLVAVGSGLIVDRLTAPFLKLLEGYWPSWPRWIYRLRRLLIRRKKNSAGAEDAKWQELAETVLSPQLEASVEDEEAFARLDARRIRRPSDPARSLPTRIGNTLRAAESRPLDKYGLDAVVIWPRLWLLMPDSARKELATARTSLDAAVATAIWGLLFCGFAAWTPLALLAGLIVSAVSVTKWVPNRAETFADLVDASYDLYRPILYQQLRWPLPANPQEEREAGKQLTAYLLRGSDAAAPIFTTPQADADAAAPQGGAA